MDRESKQSFLMTTSVNVCIFLHISVRHTLKPQRSISIYAFVRLHLNLGLQRKFMCDFIVANVAKPIIGVDFLSYCGL